MTDILVTKPFSDQYIGTFMGKQVEFSVADSLKKLEKSLENIAPAVEDAINSAIKDAAYASYASIVAKAQMELTSTRQDYLQGLDFIDLGNNSFAINLDGDWANKLEDGFPSYNMVPALLKSNKMVDVGSRAGSSWVQTSKPKGKDKETHKFAHVPFEHKASGAEGTSNLADALKNMLGKNARGDVQKMSKIFKGDDGRPMEGKVAVAQAESVTDSRFTGLVKYQKVHKSESGKETVRSLYITYRTISENGKAWVHPGWRGLKAFDQAEKELIKHIDDIIRTLT